MQTVDAVLSRLGGVATRAAILAGGGTPRGLTAAVRAGRVVRVRQGWYALPDASSDIVDAIAVGGALTGVSAGRQLGLWVLDDDRLHVAVPGNASRLRTPSAAGATRDSPAPSVDSPTWSADSPTWSADSPTWSADSRTWSADSPAPFADSRRSSTDARRPSTDSRPPPPATAVRWSLMSAKAARAATTRGIECEDTAVREICLHWRWTSPAKPVTVAPIVTTLLHAIDCQCEEGAVVMLDSALNLKKVAMRQLRAATVSLPARYSRVLDLCDGTSQSGTESLVRLRLRRLGIRVRTQVQIRSVGRVDLLVGDRLVIECDSHEFHDGDVASARDYDRDIALIDRDYVVLRLNYRQIVHEWERIEPVILRLIARGRHLYPVPSA
ncbi:hypothetical protein [Rathayibacter soli]|uniref:hypothetical protein n=1 Tax=Rathayibacter soli TaxID=3144168 RepID=UPI0027E512F9|nr:hypothetical protein [Glaciibacter superstes]